MSDPWKRKEEYKENRYPQQLEIQLNKTVEATDEEWDEWQEKELNWWAEKQIPIVAFMAFVQLFVFGGMLMAFFLIGKGLK
jgi:hypothetical protein|tara:strand:+ start:39 stop:281 length:243 start_codon:yes stop_codon:yes gene_type:complete